MRLHKLAVAIVVASWSLVPLAAADCPQAVTAAVQKAHPGATVQSCKKEQENGKAQFEVKVAAQTGKGMEIEVSPDGTIILTEQPIEISEVPSAVVDAFAAKYGSAKLTKAEMQTAADGKVAYELAFTAGGKKKEATFGSDGTFVEEE